jgi:DNA replicative helicase MCM subunit Mcm2 (Cdc46/Mcm family)
MDEFKRRMDGGIKLALEIDRMEKAEELTTIEAIIKLMKKHGLDEDETQDILFSLSKQGTLILIHDDELDVDIYRISR